MSNKTNGRRHGASGQDPGERDDAAASRPKRHQCPRLLATGCATVPELDDSGSGSTRLAHIGRLFGFEVAAYPARDLPELARTLRHLAALARLPDSCRRTLVVHVGVDGDTGGMRVGAEPAPWRQWLAMVEDLGHDLESHPGAVVLVVSAPAAMENYLRDLLARRTRLLAHPHRHTFLFPHRSSIHDAVLTWVLFYAAVAAIDFANGSVADEPRVRRLQRTLHELGLGVPTYIPHVPAAVPRGSPRAATSDRAGQQP